jgi:hypothetical protein
MSNNMEEKNNKIKIREQNIKNYSNLFINNNKKNKFSNAIHQYNNRQTKKSWGRDWRIFRKNPRKFRKYSENIREILKSNLDRFQKFKELGGINNLKQIIDNLIGLNIITESNENSKLHNIVGSNKNLDRISFFKLLIINDFYIKRYFEIFKKIESLGKIKIIDFKFEIQVYEFILKNSLLNNDDKNPAKSGMNIFLNIFYNLYTYSKNYSSLIKLLKGELINNIKCDMSNFIGINEMIKKLDPSNNTTIYKTKTNNHPNSSINTKTVFPLEKYTTSLSKNHKQKHN